MNHIDGPVHAAIFSFKVPHITVLLRRLAIDFSVPKLLKGLVGFKHYIAQSIEDDETVIIEAIVARNG